MRRFDESAREAHERAEVDQATRARITYAHEHLAVVWGPHPSVQRGAPDPRRGASLREHFRQRPLEALVGARLIARAGLTIGEAEAAGILVEGRARR